MATINGAKALGIGGLTGSLELGKAADFQVLDVSRPHAVPMFDPMTHAVYSAGRADVRHVFVDGEWRVRERELVVFDMAQTLDEVRALVPAIKASIA